MDTWGVEPGRWQVGWCQPHCNPPPPTPLTWTTWLITAGLSYRYVPQCRLLQLLQFYSSSPGNMTKKLTYVHAHIHTHPDAHTSTPTHTYTLQTYRVPHTTHAHIMHMYTCLYACTTHIQADTHTYHAHTRTNMCMHTHLNICTHMQMHTHMYTRACIHMQSITKARGTLSLWKTTQQTPFNLMLLQALTLSQQRSPS